MQEMEKMLVTRFFFLFPLFVSKVLFYMVLKGGPSDLGQKFYKNTKKSSLYSQSLLIFIHKTPVVASHPTREISDLLWSSSTQTGNTVYFYMSSSIIYIVKIHRQSFNITSDEDIMENNIFVMLWNLSVISHWIFPRCLFLFLARNLKIT